MDDIGERPAGLPTDFKSNLIQYQSPSQWTGERVELLKALWDSKLSASKIAAELGGTTRNAVIGKVRRLGLEFRREMPKGREPGPPKPRVRKAKATWGVQHNVIIGEHERITDVPMEAIPMHQRKTIHELEDCHCRWPIGSPSQSDFFYCGEATANLKEGRSYCMRHARLAYKVQPRAYWNRCDEQA